MLNTEKNNLGGNGIYSGQLEIEIYFKGYKDNFANDCRRYLHQTEGKNTLVGSLKTKVNGYESRFSIVPRYYALIRYVPINIETALEYDSKRSGSGKARGGLEIFDITGFDKEIIENLKKVLDREKKRQDMKREDLSDNEAKWFSYYKIYLREEVL
jgi:hypothetical protein